MIWSYINSKAFPFIVHPLKIQNLTLDKIFSRSLNLFGNIGVKWHFPLYSHWEIFNKSTLSLFEEFYRSLTTDKTDVSSAKSLGLKSNPLGKSFIHTKKNNGRKVHPWETPALMRHHLDEWPLRTTLWCLFLINNNWGNVSWNIWNSSVAHTLRFVSF